MTIPNYEGLRSLLDPLCFERYVRHTADELEKHFKCIIEIADNCHDARKAYSQALRALPTDRRSKNDLINAVVSSIARYLNAACGELPEPFDEVHARYHGSLTRVPQIVIAVALGLRIYQLELKLPVGACQVSMQTAFKIVDVLERHPDQWMLDLLHSLQYCPPGSAAAA